MLKKILLIILYFNTYFIIGQEKNTLSIKNGIDNPNLLTTHHFGIFSSRINTNFKIHSSTKTILSIHTTSGNNFHPFVESYFPKNPVVRKQLSAIIWHDRPFNFKDQESTPADYMNIVIDAVIKEFRLGLNIPINNKNELNINLRSYLITKGKYPFSFFTSDETLEWFHSNIAGGEDPYGRRYYGLNQVNFNYLDRHGNRLTLNHNDFFIGGIKLSHFYYPQLAINKTKNIFINFGTHLGVNTSKYNPSIDIGLSANAVKQILLKNNYEFNAAIGINLLRKNLIDFKNVIDLGNNKYLATLESNLEITKHTKKGRFNAFGVNYQIQSRYNKKEESGYYKLIGKWKEINGGWQHGVTTLYRALSNWSFIYTYGRPNMQLSLYLKEDFSVNNAPDIQTGLCLKMPILN